LERVVWVGGRMEDGLQEGGRRAEGRRREGKAGSGSVSIWPEQPAVAANPPVTFTLQMNQQTNARTYPFPFCPPSCISTLPSADFVGRDVCFFRSLILSTYPIIRHRLLYPLSLPPT
jgi:hypothetical protein